MPRQIWNEGRVQGYSAYEIYLKQALSDNPDLQPATEREWLASSIAFGSSMVVKIPKTSEDTGYLDIPLPENSKLCAANVIFANLFLGECEYDANSHFAKRVINYGFCISNTLNFHPDTNGTEIPTTDDDISLDSALLHSEAYNKIIDGVVIQPGRWKETGDDDGQYMDLSPDMSKSPFIRIFYSGKIESTIQIMLTGFTIRSVVSGVCGTDGSYNATSPQDGTFLGPAQFPWAAKIIFSQSTATSTSLNMSNYIRQIKGEESFSKLRGKPLIDMETCDPSDFYSSKQPDAKIDFDLCSLDSFDRIGNILTIHSKSEKYSPAIYATRYDIYKEKSLSPFNVVGKGSVQMFDNSTSDADMKGYEKTYPGTFALRRKDDGSIETIDEDGNISGATRIEHIDVKAIDPSNNKEIIIGKASKITSGKKSCINLSLSKDDSGTDTSRKISTGDPAQVGGTTFYPNTNNIDMKSILDVVNNDEEVDLLGDNMKLLKAGLNSGGNKNDTPYFQLPNGLRLYICGDAPVSSTEIPIGSIGIGWTEG
jgi:hypothetical protein